MGGGLKSSVSEGNTDLCDLEELDGLPDPASFGDVAAKLLESCRFSEWHYSDSLCEELVSELFKDKDVDAVFDEADCDQVRGLVSEHWQHQASVQALDQRAQHRDASLLLEETVSNKDGV